MNKETPSQWNMISIQNRCYPRGNVHPSFIEINFSSNDQIILMKSERDEFIYFFFVHQFDLLPPESMKEVFTTETIENVNLVFKLKRDAIVIN